MRAVLAFIFKQINMFRMVNLGKELLTHLVYSTELLNGNLLNSATTAPTSSPQ